MSTDAPRAPASSARDVYYIIYAVLMRLHVSHVAGRVLRSRPFNTVAALAIAVFKAVLVVLFFMHVRRQPAADLAHRVRRAAVAGDPAGADGRRLSDSWLVARGSWLVARTESRLRATSHEPRVRPRRTDRDS